MLILRALRRLLLVLLWSVNRWILRISRPAAPTKFRNIPADELEKFFLSLDHVRDPRVADPKARSYVERHLHRLVTTVRLIPPSKTSGRALELGCYMHLAPALTTFAGYKDIRGAYLGGAGQTEQKTARIEGREILSCEIDLFDAERDRFPYPDGHFELVLACEIIEHLQRDPMHMLFEIHRVLEEGGSLLLTTPNCASMSSLECILWGAGNPYIFSAYPLPEKADAELGGRHIREYTPSELSRAVVCAGFRIDALTTEPFPQLTRKDLIYDLLENYGFPVALRGEQTYCLATKVSGSARTRHPGFLYEQ